MDARSPFTETLLAARQGGDVGEPQVAPLPADYAQAMRVQREVTRALQATVAGWKVGFSPDGIAVAGPMYEVRRAPASVGLPARGFIVEIEMAFRLARDLPPKSYTRDEILDAVESVLVGIELIAGRLGEPPDAPYFAFLGDNLGNAGYVAGGSSADFRSLDLGALAVRFSVDGALVEDKRGGHPQGDPIEPLRAYASKPNDELGGLRRGQIVTTGSLTKPLRIERAGRVEAELQSIGAVRLDLTR